MNEPSEEREELERLRLVRERFAPATASNVERIQGGWDCYTYDVGGEWIVQLPRLPQADSTLRAQLEILPALAPELPAPIPVPELVSERPLCIAYRRIEGTPVHGEASVQGIWPERLGRFLFDLHLVPSEFVGLRPIVLERWRADVTSDLDSFRSSVFPLLDPDEVSSAESAFDRFLAGVSSFALGVVHRDLGPEHVLVRSSGDLAGVIDWGDVGIGDPAIDFSWLLFGAPEVGERALGAYGGEPDAAFRDRARFYHVLGPWHEVRHGIETEQPTFVHTGIEGIRARIGAWRD